jgi:alginate O-acetyltransferase complex protein AlgI
MTDNIGEAHAAGWICYDGDCPLCLRWLRRVERPLLRHGFRFVPLQSEWARTRLALASNDPLIEMRLLRPGEPVLGGADAAAILMRHVWWLWPVWLLSRIPGVMLFYRSAYRRIAANRHCTNGTCSLRSRGREKAPTDFRSWTNWLPLIGLLLATLPFRGRMPDWIFMWLFVAAMFAGCKWLTWRRALDTKTNPTRTFGYLLLWPGMDAKAFLTGHNTNLPSLSEWCFAFGRFVAGITLVWLAAQARLTPNPIANAWIAMFGLTLILHFGVFHLAALAWQRAGAPAKPLMQSPATATSLADFWGSRWNTAFNKLVYDLAFRPLARGIGINWATLGVFAISGAIHELAISFPARGGYGFPLAYFLLQGVGVVTERSQIGRSLGLARGSRGWLFMLLFTAAPAYWLFHPPFVKNVILPMLQTIRAM